MAQKLNDKDVISFKELLMANSIQVDALAQLLIEKGLVSREESFRKLKEVPLSASLGKGINALPGSLNPACALS